MKDASGTKRCARGVRGYKRRLDATPSTSALTQAGSILILLQLVESASAASQHLFMHSRDEGGLSIRSAPVDVAHNKPVQLVIIIACIILFAMLASTIACFYRMPKTKEEIMEEEKEARRNSWSPTIAVNNRHSNVYSINDENQMDSKRNSNGSTMSYQSFGSQSGSGQGYGVRKQMYGKVAQDGSRGVRGPNPGPRAATYHSQGFNVLSRPPSNLRNPIIADDLESAGSNMSRRPSFIDRALAHRADPHDARLPCNQDSERPLPLPSKERKTTGGSLLSALSSSFMGSRENTRSSRAVDSEFEGTIGGRDGEIPMAKRSRDPRLRFPCDTSTAAPTPILQNNVNDGFSPLPARCSIFADHQVMPTPRSTPGLAGVGTTMATLPAVPIPPAAMGRVRSFADLQRAAIQSDEPNLWRTQASMDDWIQSSQVAERPPLSRKGTDSSFMTSTPLKDEIANGNLERMKSIQPRFAPTTTLASWLNEDDVRDVNSVIGGYLVEGDETIESDGKSHLSSEAENVNSRKINLWEGSPHRHSDGDAAKFQIQRQIQRDDKGRAMSADAAVVATTSRSLPPVPWSAREEDLEEQKRQIDKRQAYLLREKRKSDRRLFKLQREKVLQSIQVQRREAMRQSDDETSIAAVSIVPMEQESKKMQHFVLEMEEEKGEKVRREEHLQMQARLRQSVQPFHAPVFGHHHHHQQQQQQQFPRMKLSKMEIPHRAPMRAPSLSPPESPLTSASEGSNQYFRPKKGNFLVHSRKNSQGTIAMTHRSMSHSSSMQHQHSHSRDQLDPQILHQRQLANRCVSENRPVLYY